MRTVVRLFAAVVLVLAAAVPVLAKEGLEARLDRPIPLDGDPGGPVTVGFTVAAVGSDPASYSGQPVFLRVHPVGGEAVEVGARGDGDGHYTATFAMPVHGVAAVEIGLRGEMCEHGTCARSDILFRVAGPEGAGTYTSTTVAPPANPGKVGSPAASAPVIDPGMPSVPAPVTSVPMLGLLAVGALVVAAAGTLVVTFRRSAGAGAART